MAKIIKVLKGTKDILPQEVEQWHRLEKNALEIFTKYGYKEIRTPIFEMTELFARGVGDTTDIVNKEMYTFNDKAGRSITLRLLRGGARPLSKGTQKPSSVLVSMGTGREKAQSRTSKRLRNGTVNQLGRDIPRLSADLDLHIFRAKACHKVTKRRSNGSERPLSRGTAKRRNSLAICTVTA